MNNSKRNPLRSYAAEKLTSYLLRLHNHPAAPPAIITARAAGPVSGVEGTDALVMIESVDVIDPGSPISDPLFPIPDPISPVANGNSITWAGRV